MSLSREDRIRGGMWGALIGDAVGVPYEFHPPTSIPRWEEIDMIPPPGFQRAHDGTPPGTWSDDGAHLLCLLESLLKCGELDITDLSQRMCAWRQYGHLAVDGRVFDIGVQTSVALDAIEGGTPPETAAPSHETSNGNGSLMRTLPLALWHSGSDLDLVEAAHRQSLPTHPHPRSQVCCAIYALWARYELESPSVGTHFGQAVQTVRAIYGEGTPHAEALEFNIRPDVESTPRGSGYVVDTLRSARHALDNHGTFESVIRAAISLGRDTDTTACVAGGIAGIRHGIVGVPKRWMQRLRGREIAEPLIETLVRSRGSSGSMNTR